MKGEMIGYGIIWAACIGAAVYSGTLWWLILPLLPILIPFTLLLAALICAGLWDLKEWLTRRDR